MNIKSLVLGSLVTIGSIFGGVEAKADNHSCYWTNQNDHICVYNVRGNSSFKTFDMNVNGQYAGNQGVRCNPNHRYNYKENAYGIACFEFSY